MAILNNSNAISTAGGYNINNSLRFRNSASAYLSRTPGSAPTDGKKLTLSCWVKRGILTGSYYIMQSGAGTGNDNYSGFYFRSDNTIQVSMYSVTPRVTTQVFRDPSAWYHLVLAYDTTQATAGDRVKLYVNGTQVTAFTTNGTIPQNTLIAFTKQSQAVYIGTASDDATYFDGYMAEFNLIDGQQLTPSSFGETSTTTGSWVPKAYTGTYGTNGFYLKFSDIATTSGSNAGLGKDFSGNTNYWNTTNISVTAGTTYDAMIDSPTLTSATVANYAVLNPLWINSNLTLAGANLNVTSSGNGGTAISTIAMESGKYYCEATINTGSDATSIGIVNSSFNPSLSSPTLSGANAVGYYGPSGAKFVNGTESSYGASYTTGDIIGIALDITAGTVTFYKNNTSQGAITHGLTGPFYFATSDVSSGSNINQSWNFGQRPFSYTPPSGFVRLNTYNLPSSTIPQGNKVMDSTLYTGNGTSQTITNAGAFRPDLVWIKQRSSTEQNQLMDSVRGSSKVLNSNLTNAESTDATKLTAFNSNGFSVGSELAVNANGSTYVGWQWQAGQGSTSSNTSGSITSTVSVSTTAGFSVATWTAPGSGSFTVGHGLGVAPKFIITKVRNTADNWLIWHTSIGSSGYLLFTTGASATNSTIYNGLPTSTLINYGSYLPSNGSTYVTYSWAEIAGFSAFGSYTGNGSTDGTFVYTGFRPAYLLIKRSSGVEDWFIFDNKRLGYNVDNNYLYADINNAEGVVDYLDILSNGFKARSTNSAVNTSGSTYIYAAFAENPFKNANAR